MYLLLAKPVLEPSIKATKQPVSFLLIMIFSFTPYYIYR